MSTLLVVLLAVMKLFFVQEVRKGDQETVVVFVGGETAVLQKSDAGYEGFVRLAERSRERGVPIGVSIDRPEKSDKPDKPDEPGKAPQAPPRILEVVRASSDVVLEIVPSQKDKNVSFVRLKAHNGIHTLRADNPEFKRISELLADSVQNGTKVWLVSKPDLTIVDAIKVEPKKDEPKKDEPKKDAPVPADAPK